MMDIQHLRDRSLSIRGGEHKLIHSFIHSLHLSFPIPSPLFLLSLPFPPNPTRVSGDGVWGGAPAEIEFGAF